MTVLEKMVMETIVRQLPSIARSLEKIVELLTKIAEK